MALICSSLATDYKQIFNAVVDIIMVAEADTRKIFLANTKACLVLGYTGQELRGMMIDKIHPPESLDFVLDTFQRLAGGKMELVQDIPVQTRSGEIIFTEITATPIEMSGKNLLIGVFRDITQKRKFENELRLIQFAVDASSDAMAMATAEGRHYYQNEAFTRLFEYSIDEVASSRRCTDQSRSDVAIKPPLTNPLFVAGS